MTREALLPEHSWIADLIGAIWRLEPRQLAALAAQYESGSAIPPTTTQLQRSLSLSTTDAARLSRSLEKTGSLPDVAARDIRVALATIAQARSSIHAAEAERVEVVCTAPAALGVPVRTTFATSLEMVRATQEEVLVVGYVFSEGAAKLIEHLAVARRDRGVSIVLLGNRMENQLIGLRRLWPADSPQPRILSRHPDPSDDMAALHAKLLICDRAAARVTSANFSYHGLHENIEIGVKIRSAAVRRLVDFVEALIRTREVEPVASWS